MNPHIFRLFMVLLLCWLVEPVLRAGDMPKGNFNGPLSKPTVESKKIKEPAEGPKGATRDETATYKEGATLIQKDFCNTVLVNMLPNQSMVENSGDFMYLLVDNPWKLAKQKKSLKSPGSKESAIRPKKTLVKFHLETPRFEPLVSLAAHKGTPFLMVHSGGVSALHFLGDSSECGFGKAMMVSMSLAKGGEGNKAVHQTGNYKMVRSNSGWILADLNKKTLVETDGVTFQMRTERKLLSDGDPIYYDPTEKILVHWYEKGDIRGILVEKGVGVSKTLRKIAVPKGEHILTSPHGIGVIKQQSTLQLTLETIKGLTRGTEGSKAFIIKSPVDDPLSKLAFEVDFENKRALVLAKTINDRKFFKKAWIYDLGLQDPVEVIAAPADQYVHFASLSTEGVRAFFELRSVVTGYTSSVKVYDFEKKALENYPFQLTLVKNSP